MSLVFTIQIKSWIILFLTRKLNFSYLHKFFANICITPLSLSIKRRVDSCKNQLCKTLLYLFACGLDQRNGTKHHEADAFWTG